MSRGKTSGRKARLAKRAAAPSFDPCPPGQLGGQYRPLSDSDLKAIYDTALRLLETLGMGEVPDRLARDLLAAGAIQAGNRLQFPRDMVQSAIKHAAKTFTLHGRDPARSIIVGGQKVYFGTGGAAVQTLDIDTSTYRPATLQDLHNFTRLQDHLANVSWFTRCCIATDVAGEYPLDPFMKTHISPVISPMRFGEDAVDVVYACIAHNIPISCITAAQAGATAPATMAGFLAQSLAETLASLVMVNVISPGFPMVFSNWPLVIDLRSGAFSGGSGETALLNAASAQLSNWLGLPSGVASSMTDAKAIDAQYGVEKAMTSFAAATAGGNLIYESSGMTASLLGASFEAFVLDDEMHSHTYRALRGVEVSQANLGYDAICEAVLGDGHFLGGAHTLAAMERDYFYPTLADRDEPRTWAQSGAQDAWARAKAKAQDILATHTPTYLTPDQDAAIRGEFDILL